MQFMAYMKTPQYKASLQQLLEQEKVGLIFNISTQNCRSARLLDGGGGKCWRLELCTLNTSAAPGQL